MHRSPAMCERGEATRAEGRSSGAHHSLARAGGDRRVGSRHMRTTVAVGDLRRHGARPRPRATRVGEARTLRPTQPADSTPPIRAAFYWLDSTARKRGDGGGRIPALDRTAGRRAQIRALRYAGFDAAIASWTRPGGWRTVASAASSPQLDGWARRCAGRSTIARRRRAIRARPGSPRTSAASPRARRRTGLSARRRQAGDLRLRRVRRLLHGREVEGRRGRPLHRRPEDLHELPDLRGTARGVVPVRAAAAAFGTTRPLLRDQPGLSPAGEAPRLRRDRGRFRTDVRAMVASNAPWQLVTSFNGWREGSAVESGAGWRSRSGYGRFLDVLRREIARPSPAPPEATPVPAPPPAPAPEPTSPAPPPPVASAAVSCRCRRRGGDGRGRHRVQPQRRPLQRRPRDGRRVRARGDLRTHGRAGPRGGAAPRRQSVRDRRAALVQDVLRSDLGPAEGDHHARSPATTSI